MADKAMIYFAFCKANVAFRFEREGSNVPGKFSSMTRVYQGFDPDKDKEIIRELRKFVKRNDERGKSIVKELPHVPKPEVLEKFSTLLHRGRIRVSNSRNSTEAQKAAIQELETDMVAFAEAAAVKG